MKYLRSVRITSRHRYCVLIKPMQMILTKLLQNWLKTLNLHYISHENIWESHIHEYGLHINKTGSSILAKNLISGVRNFSSFWDSKKEVNIDGLCLENIRFYDNLGPESKTISTVPDEHQDDIILGLKNLHIKYSDKIIMGHLNMNSIRNKFELLSSLIGKIDIHD